MGIEMRASPTEKGASVNYWLPVQGSGFGVQGSGFRVQGSGFRVRPDHAGCFDARKIVQTLQHALEESCAAFG